MLSYFGIHCRPGAAILERAMIRVLIADDQEVVRQGIAALLTYQDDLEVVGKQAMVKRLALWRSNSNPMWF